MLIPVISEELLKRTTSRCPVCHASVPAEVWKVSEAKGARVQVYEAEARVGGRVWSLRDVFPGQTAERGAELIDTTHVTLRGLAKEMPAIGRGSFVFTVTKRVDGDGKWQRP